MAKKDAPTEPTEPTGHDVPAESEVDPNRVDLVTTHNVSSGIDEAGNPLDHVASPFDHVIEVSN